MATTDHVPPLSRRRFIAIAGAAAGSLLWPGASRAAVPVHRWSGTALGAAASIRLAHPDGEVARALIDRSVAEIGRLERIFSLYREDSALSRLNRDGRLSAPPLELVEVLARAAEVSRATDGVFDVTIQPLWRCYAEHFAKYDSAPPRGMIDAARRLVDWRAVEIETDRIGYRRRGMAATLNGIAQGFVTDRVAELLRRAGLEAVLLDLGETRALGRHPGARPWCVGIADPAGSERLVGRLALDDRALATSGGYGTLLDRAGRYSHLIDPRDGRTAPAARGVSVLAADATTADAYSTAFALMAEGAIETLAARRPDLEVFLADAAGFRRLTV